MKISRLVASCCWVVACAAGPALAQTPLAGQNSGAAALGAVSLGQAPSASPEQVELSRITAENMIADQKTKRKLQQLNDDKEAARVEYELLSQKQKLKMAELEAEIERLGAGNRLNAEQHRRDLDALQTELDKVSAENRLTEEKRKAESAALESEYQKLAAQNRLAEERSKSLLLKQNDELVRLSLENRLSAELGKKAVDDLTRQLDKARLGNDLRSEAQRERAFADETEKRAIDLGLKRIELEERKLQLEKEVMDGRMAKLKSDLELRDRKEDWKKQANTEPNYLARPFEKGRLVISDRRITLNGPIFHGVADRVTERIHYYNNISSAPIFIVIDYCPGGSVMEGYRIVKAMQASRAPVNVVVKSFAASMAAVITTMADKSYVYPNAIILHHQMSTMNWGNMTQLKEQLDLAKEWERRLHMPVAKKMGISMDEFRKRMYEKNSDGDWEEFGDKAVSYKWATAVVEEIDETGFIKNPDYAEKPKEPGFALAERTDEKGSRYVSLPRLQPFDFYFIYNPDRYFR